MAKRFDPGALMPIEVELQREKASALGRAGRKLEQLVEKLERLERELRHLHGEARTKRLAEYRKVRTQAVDQHWKLMVQREAVGLSRHDDLDRHYPIPPPL